MGKHVRNDELIDAVIPSKALNSNWWDELPNHVKLGINDSLEQANRGEFISIEDVKIQVSALLNQSPSS